MTAKERPILFSTPMVQAVLDGRKTMTRQVINKLIGFGRITEFSKTDTPGYDFCFRDKQMLCHDVREKRVLECCPYGKPGDRLWVKETFRPIYPQDPTYNNGKPIDIDYRATYKEGYRLGDHLGWNKWKSPRFMPRSTSRILLEVTDVRIQRLQDISEADAKAEGAPVADIVSGRALLDQTSNQGSYRWGFRLLRDSINGPCAWDANPFVWVISFKRIEQ